MNWLTVVLSSSLVGSIIGALISNTAAKKREMHGESNWRDKLLQECGLSKVGISDIYELKAKVHPFLTKDIGKFDVDDFVICFCDYVLKRIKEQIEYKGPEYNCLEDKDAEYYRLVAMILLKYDWESSKKFFNFKKKKISNMLLNKLYLSNKSLFKEILGIHFSNEEIKSIVKNLSYYACTGAEAKEDNDKK